MFERQWLTFGVLDKHHHIFVGVHCVLDEVLFLSLDYPVAVVVPSPLDFVVVVEVIFLCPHVLLSDAGVLFVFVLDLKLTVPSLLVLDLSVSLLIEEKHLIPEVGVIEE